MNIEVKISTWSPTQHDIEFGRLVNKSFLAQLVERVTSNDEVSRSSRLMGILLPFFLLRPILSPLAVGSSQILEYLPRGWS